jgi:hypothetical protein
MTYQEEIKMRQEEVANYRKEIAKLQRAAELGSNDPAHEAFVKELSKLAQDNERQCNRAQLILDALLSLTAET